MINITEKNISRKEKISLKFIFNNIKNRFNLQLFTNEEFLKDKFIKEHNLHRPGLALAGFVDLFSSNRIQVFGNTEMKYLESLSSEKRYKAVKRIMELDIPCILFTDNNKPCPEVLKLADEYKTPLIGSTYQTTKLLYLISDFLDDQFVPRISVHGSFVDVYGVGMLFAGKSGVGKSEVALDLVERGHRLVADDVVILTKKGEGILMGSGTEIVEHFMEVRGIGIVDIKNMFGVRAIRFQKRLEVVIELEIWDDNMEYTRTGLDDSIINIADVDIQYVRIPIVPGKNLTVIAEVIALNYLLKHNTGYDAAKVFNNKLMQKLKERSNNDNSANRSINYFEHDFE